nr:EOG090X07YX [Lepidurus arcticus]
MSSSKNLARRSIRPPGSPVATMNFRPSTDASRSTAKGTKPLPDPTSVPQVLLLMLVHICRKILFIDPSIKVGVYLLVVFAGSVVSDTLPMPRSYFSRKENSFNQYFVKLSWAWTMIVVGVFMYLTTRIYCCGEELKIRRHFCRLVTATAFWWFWTSSFVHFEENYGYCSKAQQQTKKHCLAKGATWQTLSVSGHSFILVYCSLIIMEEAKALIGWEGIKDCIRIEEHNRTVICADDDKEDTGLELLPRDQFEKLKEDYRRFTPYVRALFIAMTGLAVLWDVMLIATVLYFHTMVEKFLASAIAVLVWFFTYRYWYRGRTLSPGLPGDGLFRYMNPLDPLRYSRLKRQFSLRNAAANEGKRTATSQRDAVPMFMGMPLNALRSQNQNLENSDTGGAKRNVNSLEPI